MPRTVVSAVFMTGLRRVTPEETSASNGFAPASSCALISSIMTIAFFTCIPTSDRNPRSAMNPNGWSNPRSPATTPTTMRGTVRNTASVFLSELKSITMTSTMTTRITGSLPMMLSLASRESSYSPPQLHEYPAGSVFSIASSLSFTRRRASLAVPLFGLHFTVMHGRRSRRL